jgi:hypothetical protein
MPGGETHKGAVEWLEGELKAIDGLQVTSTEHDLRVWEPAKGETLGSCSKLSIGSQDVRIASTVAYSLPTTVTAPLVYIPSGTPLTSENAAGKIVVRDTSFPRIWPYALISLISYFTTRDLPYFSRYKRPATDDQLIEDMLVGSRIGVKGYIDVLDVPREYMEGHFTPHDGVFYKLPGLFVGCDEGAEIKKAAKAGKEATITVRADVSESTTKNLTATLPGESKKRRLGIGSNFLLGTDLHPYSFSPS